MTMKTTTSRALSARSLMKQRTMFLSAVRPHQPVDPDEAEDPEQPETRRQAAQEIQPAALLDEVDPLRMRPQQPDGSRPGRSP